MKARTVLALASILLASILPVRAQQGPAKTDKELNRLLGPVKTFREEWCIVAEDPNNPGEFVEGELTHVYTLTFDRDGKKIKQDPPPYVCGTSLLIESQQKRDRILDDNGRAIEEKVSTLEGQLLFRYTYTYDSQGRIAELTNYSAKGIVQYKWGHKYDSNGREMETLHYGHGGTLDETTVRVFDDHVHVIARTVYDGNGRVKETAIITREYDSYGNWTKAVESQLRESGGGKPSFTPTRVDYQILTYYSDADDPLS